MKARLSKTMRAVRFGMATATGVSRATLSPSSPGRPARSTSRVVRPQGRPARADLVALLRDREARDRGLGAHPVAGLPVGAAGGRGGEGEAGARRLGVGLGADLATSRPAARRAAASASRMARILRRALDHRFQRGDLLRRAVQPAQASAITSREGISGGPPGTSM
jgi:hypothetical protein